VGCVHFEGPSQTGHLSFIMQQPLSIMGFKISKMYIIGREIGTEGTSSSHTIRIPNSLSSCLNTIVINPFSKDLPHLQQWE